LSAVFVNCIGIVVGALCGIALKRFLSSELLARVEQAFGYAIIILGIKMALEHQNFFIVLASLGIGAALGHYLDLNARIESLSSWLQRLVAKGDMKSSFSRGFFVASVLFCTGAMAIVGAIEAGAAKNYEVLYAKTVIDSVLSLVFASIYGIGVAFSAVPVLVYQGLMVLGAEQLSFLSNPVVLAEIKGTGGVLLLMIGLSLAKLKDISVSDFLPAIPVVMVIMFFYS